MLFPTIDFAAFFAAVFGLNWLLRSRPIPWRLTMLAASLLFYGWWDARFVPLIGASIVANHLLAGRVTASGKDSRARKGWLAAAVAANLGVLGWFKYYGFFATSVADGLDTIGLSVSPPLLDIILPVGISFFTFQALSYVIDVSRGDVDRLCLLDFAVYLSFFPQLVAGPIVRASEFAPQLAEPPPRRLFSGEAFGLIAAGLFKKMVVSSYLAAELVDPVFAVPQQHSAGEILLATYAYAIQIYADFSGYTDIAIGVALLLGFRFPQNFNAPYAALSLQDFWRRWHMTLSRWLRDYLYVGLGGNRRGTIFTYRNLLLTMLLGGLWHGAAWTYVIWGALHGCALGLERAIGGWWHRGAHRAQLVPTAVSTAVRWFLTFHFVCLAWIFFRADSVSLALDMIGRLFTSWGPAPLVTGLVVALVAASVAAQWIPRDTLVPLRRRFTLLNPAIQGVALGAVLLVIDALGPDGIAPFIYFQF